MKAVVLAIVLCCAAVDGAQADEKWQGTFQKAQELAQQGDFKAALRAYNKATKQADGPRMEILIGQARCHNKLGSFDDAAKVARQALPLATGVSERIAVHSQLGTALYAAGEGTPDQLNGAAQSFRQILELSEGRIQVARFNLGMALLSLEEDAAGVAELQAFVDGSTLDAKLEPGGLVQQAKTYIANPRRARADVVPEFAVQALDGSRFSDRDLLGKVYVLDFWGTWCAPCVAAIPHLRNLTKKHRDDPFVLLSVSNDRQRDVLERFLAKESMHWPQIHDHDRRLMGSIFKVSRYPTYWVVDHEGTIVHRGSGWSTQVAQQLDRAVAKALKKARKSDEGGSP